MDQKKTGSGSDPEKHQG